MSAIILADLVSLFQRETKGYFVKYNYKSLSRFLLPETKRECITKDTESNNEDDQIQLSEDDEREEENSSECLVITRVSKVMKNMKVCEEY